MAYIILPNFQVVLLFIYPDIESFKKVFMRHLVIGGIVIYCTTIIPNTLDKVAYCIKLKVVKA